MFTSFDTESKYDWVTINRCTSSSCTTVEQVARLSGKDVSAGMIYTSATGFIQLMFTSDESISASGFVASWWIDVEITTTPETSEQTTSSVTTTSPESSPSTTPSSAVTPVLKLTLGIPIEKSQYDERTQLSVREAIAVAAQTDISYVQILGVSVIRSTTLLEAISIEIVIRTTSATYYNANASELVNVDILTSELQKRDLPRATLLESVMFLPSGLTTSATAHKTTSAAVSLITTPAPPWVTTTPVPMPKTTPPPDPPEITEDNHLGVVSENAASALVYVVKMTLMLSISKNDFTEDKQKIFRESIATVADVKSADVTIDKIAATTTSVRRSSRQLRLFSELIRVELSITAGNASTAGSISSALTVDKINEELQKAGLPKVTMLDAPRVVTQTVVTVKRTQCCSGFGRLGPDGACGGRQDMCPESLMGAEDPAKCQVGNFDGHATSLCTVHYPLCRAKWEVKYCSEKEICRAVTCVEKNPRKGTDWTSFYQGCYDNSSVLLQSEAEIAAKIAGSSFLHEHDCFEVRTHSDAVINMQKKRELLLLQSASSTITIAVFSIVAHSIVAVLVELLF